MKNNAVEEKRKKKQHYVPQCYLEYWAIEGTHQIHVYDKKKKLYRTTFKMSHLKTIFMILIFERHFPGKSKTCWQ